MDKKGYLFWDDETANKEHRICQAAFLITDFNGRLINRPVCSLINPETKEIGPWNRRNLNIDWDCLPQQQTFDCFWDNHDLTALLNDYVLVAHNANGADIHHIRKSLSLYAIEMPDFKVIDTMLLARQNGLPGALSDLCDRFNIKIDKHHDALADAEACCQVFFKLDHEYGHFEPTEWSFARSTSNKRRRRFTGLGLVHKTEETVEDILNNAELEGIRGDVSEIDNPVGLRVKISGVTPGYTRDEILSALKSCGIHATEGKPGKKTEYLAIGDNVGKSKLDAILMELHPRGSSLLESFLRYSIALVKILIKMPLIR